jgi:hypothetical protein
VSFDHRCYHQIARQQQEWPFSGSEGGSILRNYAQRESASKSSWTQKHPTLAWSIPVALSVLTIIAAMIFGGLSYLEKYEEAQIKLQVADSLTGPRSDISVINQKLSNIEGQLSVLAPLITQLTIRKQATSSQQEFEKALPQVKSALYSARQDKVSIEPKIITDLQHKFESAKQSEPNYWPAALEFISYHSSALEGGRLDWLTLPLCKTGNFDTATMQPLDPDYHPLGPPVPIANMKVQQCALILDGKDISKMTFENCLVFYHGGNVKLKDVTFRNCLFDFRIENAVSPDGEKLASALLAADIQKATVSTSWELSLECRTTIRASRC